ncbi:MAG TPA: ASKHA domain-containing protein, partial [Anaerolineales bacterium]|nr:ASKHA domain-containing protein [Anaerolineales bacterium]
LWGTAIDIGTTTVSLWLVDLVTGQVRAQVAEYNGQIARGEDVISRIVYTGKNGGREDLRQRVLDTMNSLLETACKRVKTKPESIVKATIAGNSTMMHLLLGIPAESIRLSPFITGVNHLPVMAAHEVGLGAHPEASVDCLPGVASYVGADITAGVLSSGVDTAEETTLFLDVGTNGEIVLGDRDWLVTCACSAGPAFEGAGVVNGMRATQGAIEEVWINGDTFEPTYRVIGGGKPKGICGSGLISLLSEAFITGILDKGGNVNLLAHSPRVREGAHGGEYVVAWGAETESGEDIVISRVDVDNLLRAKAAIYAGFTVLAETVGISLEAVSRVLVGGSFGKYINVEKAVQIGLLPDMDWSRFEFLGNTSVKGAYLALLDWQKRERITEIAKRMTYIELSADNTFYEAFTSALFLPHTDLGKFPSVEAALKRN